MKKSDLPEPLQGEELIKGRELVATFIGGKPTQKTNLSGSQIWQFPFKLPQNPPRPGKSQNETGNLCFDTKPQMLELAYGIFTRIEIIGGKEMDMEHIDWVTEILDCTAMAGTLCGFTCLVKGIEWYNRYQVPLKTAANVPA